MRKRILHILNWNKYQARSDKELPWLKLWGRLFRTPWFQLLPDEEKFVTIAFLDLARQFNNNIPEELIFKGYLRGNYGVFISQERIIKLTQVLVLNDFLSDNCPTNVEVEGDKIRVDKIKDRRFVEPSVEVVIEYFEKELKGTKDQALRFFQFYGSKDWFVGDNKMKNWHLAAARSLSWKDDGRKSGTFLTKPQSHLSDAIKRMEAKNEVRHIQEADGGSIISLPEPKD